MKRTKKSLSHDEIQALDHSELAAATGGGDYFPYGILQPDYLRGNLLVPRIRDGFPIGIPGPVLRSF
jgi:hypothetical protein